MRANYSNKTWRLAFGLSTVVTGFITNEYFLALLIPPADGDIRLAARILIWVFQGSLITFGALLILQPRLWLTLGNFVRCCRKEISFYKLSRISLSGIVIALIVLQSSHLIGLIYLNSDTYDIIYSEDTDAGSGIASAKKTSLLRGGSRFHGVFYQRLGHYGAKISPVFKEDEDIQSERKEITDRQIHFALQLVSLCSLYGLLVLLAVIISRDVVFRLVVFYLLSVPLTNNVVWVTYVYRVHPDLLLALMVGLFIYFSLRYRINGQLITMLLSAITAGCALSTKLTFLLFLPVIPLLFIPPLTWRSIKKIAVFGFLVIGVYIIAAYPRSISVLSTLEMLAYQSSYSRSPTLSSINGWGVLFFEGGGIFLLSVVAASWILGSNMTWRKRDKNSWLMCVLITFIPIVLLLSRDTFSPNQHYVLPFIAGVAVLLSAFFGSAFMDYEGGKQRKTYAIFPAWILVIVSMASGVVVPENISTVIQEVMKGREVTRLTYKEINHYADQGKRVLVDQYVPHRVGHQNIQLDSLITAEKFKKYHPDVFALNEHNVRRFLAEGRPSEYVLQGLGAYDLDDLRQFYQHFFREKHPIGPLGNSWRLVLEDGNGVKVWIKS